MPSQPSAAQTEPAEQLPPGCHAYDLLVPTAGGQTVRLHVVEAGPPTGPVALLLHGFPEYWAAWERQIAPLARAGYRVVMPDMRGYNLSEKPQGIAPYRMSLLVADVVGLIGLLGGPVHLVAHDWGGVVAWNVAIMHPELLRDLVILNAPHPRRAPQLMKTPGQLRRSWYIRFFQWPVLPELMLVPYGRWALRANNPAAFTPAELAQHRQVWRRPGVASATINYYRALARYGHDKQAGKGQVGVRTLVIWGLDDAALVPEQADGLERWVPDLRVVRLPHASHWVMRDEPVKVNNLLLEFLAGTGTGTNAGAGKSAGAN